MTLTIFDAFKRMLAMTTDDDWLFIILMVILGLLFYGLFDATKKEIHRRKD